MFAPHENDICDQINTLPRPHGVLATCHVSGEESVVPVLTLMMVTDPTGTPCPTCGRALRTTDVRWPTHVVLSERSPDHPRWMPPHTLSEDDIDTDFLRTCRPAVIQHDACGTEFCVPYHCVDLAADHESVLRAANHLRHAPTYLT